MKTSCHGHASHFTGPLTHWSLVVYPHKWQSIRSFGGFYVVTLNMLLKTVEMPITWEAMPSLYYGNFPTYSIASENSLENLIISARSQTNVAPHVDNQRTHCSVVNYLFSCKLLSAVLIRCLHFYSHRTSYTAMMTTPDVRHGTDTCCIYLPSGRLIIRSREVSTLRDCMMIFLHRFEIWQASRQQRCQDACQIS